MQCVHCAMYIVYSLPSVSVTITTVLFLLCSCRESDEAAEKNLVFEVRLGLWPSAHFVVIIQLECC